MKFKNLLRVASLLIMLASFIPVNQTAAAASSNVPPVDMFQLPWDQGIAWYAIDGVDNGTKRPATSSHNYHLGGAIDFAPRTDLKTGDDTSTAWVTAAAAGTVVEISSCHMKIAHSDGWLTEYQFLGNIQVKLGDVVQKNQRLGVVADGVKYKYCSGYVDPNVPHLHFMLRPSVVGATFAGWTVNYSSLWNSTSFTRNGTTVGLFKPLLNAPVAVSTPTPLPPTATPVPTEITPTPTGPYVSTTVDPVSVNIGDTSLATVRLNNVPSSGYTSAEFTCSYDVNLASISNIAVADLFGTDSAVAINDPQNGSFIVAIAGSKGNKATTSGTAFTFNVKALQTGDMAILCNARVNTGDNVLTSLPALGATLTIYGDTPTPTDVPTQVVASPTPIVIVDTQTPAEQWLTLIDSTYGFEFQYPSQGLIAEGADDNFTRIDLPFVQGTNLREKYLEMIVAQNTNSCESPLTTQSMLETSQTVVINGISFLKQTGQDANVGNLHQWIAYSTSRDNTCVSLDFIFHSLNSGNFPTPPPTFDYAAESVVFDQMVSTYAWLALAPTATPVITNTPDISTPTFTPVPVESLTPTFTPSPSATLPSTTDGTVTGQVIASKSVTVSLYDSENTLITSVTANSDGTFLLTAPAGTYSLVAVANGFLPARGSVTLVGGSTVNMLSVTLPAGDIDGNNVIDQFDALTIGMSYNMSTPSTADLNNDGIINVLDLELLAQNYRMTGPIVWG